MTLNTSWPADDEEFLSWLNSHFVDILRAWQDNEPTEFNQPELIGRIYQLARSKRLFSLAAAAIQLSQSSMTMQKPTSFLPSATDNSHRRMPLLVPAANCDHLVEAVCERSPQNNMCS